MLRYGQTCMLEPATVVPADKRSAISRVVPIEKRYRQVWNAATGYYELRWRDKTVAVSAERWPAHVREAANG